MKMPNNIIKDNTLKLDDKEYERLHNTLEYNLNTRISLLTFAFTTVLAVLGVAIGTENKDISVYMYLIPYCLIIPFSARIVYYRLVHAHISAFLMVYSPEKMLFRLGSSTNSEKNIVSEKQTKFFNVIAFLNNYEMSILSLTCAVIFYFKFFSEKTEIENIELTTIEWIMCIVPIVLTILVIVITAYGYDYSKHLYRYKEKWEEFYNKNTNEKCAFCAKCKPNLNTQYKILRVYKVKRCKKTK